MREPTARHPGQPVVVPGESLDGVDRDARLPRSEEKRQSISLQNMRRAASGHDRLRRARADRREEVNGRADVYSLGCVLYECLVGQQPFRRDSDLAVVFAHLETEVPTLRSRGLAGERADELGSRAYAELPVDVTEMPLDRLRTEKQLGAGLAVRLPFRDDERDL
jgi:serine/threonine protein kinase